MKHWIYCAFTLALGNADARRRHGASRVHRAAQVTDTGDPHGLQVPVLVQRTEGSGTDQIEQNTQISDEVQV